LQDETGSYDAESAVAPNLMDPFRHGRSACISVLTVATRCVRTIDGKGAPRRRIVARSQRGRRGHLPRRGARGIERLWQCRRPQHHFGEPLSWGNSGTVHEPCRRARRSKCQYSHCNDLFAADPRCHHTSNGYKLFTNISEPAQWEAGCVRLNYFHTVTDAWSQPSRSSFLVTSGETIGRLLINGYTHCGMPGS
jgi:hypothetical protein